MVDERPYYVPPHGLRGLTHSLFTTRPRSFAKAVLLLIGHLLGTAAIFLALFTIIWFVSYALAWLDSVHKFPPPLLTIVTNVEVWGVYGDAFVCILVVAASAWRFVLDIVEG